MADLDLRRSRMLWLLGLVVMAGMLSVSVEAQDKSDPGLDLYYNANSLCHRRFYKQAIDEYKRFLTKYPNHAKVPRAKWGMAISLYNLDRLKAAQPLLSELVGNAEITAQDKVHNLLGSCLLELGKHAEAEKAFAWTIANAKDAKGKLTTNARVGLVEALYLQKKWGELVKASDALLDSAPESSHADNARFQGAVARSKQGQHDEAAAVFEKIIAASKDAKLVHRATFRLAECKQLTGKLAQAAAMYAKVAKTSKGVYSEYAQYDLGVVYFLQKDYKKAIDELLGFNKLYPKSALGPQARLHLGRAYLETKNYAQAAACLKKLIAKTSTVRAPAVLWLARTYSRQNSNATVESMLTPVIESFAGTPELPGMLNELATAQMRMKKFPAAAAMFGRARGVSKPPQSTEFLRLQAFCLNQAGQHDESIKLTDAFLKLDSAQASKLEVMFIKADNLMMLKKPAEALAVYTKILAVDPKHARASQMHFRIAQVHVGSKQWAQAAQHLTALLAGDNSGKTFKQASFMLGNCYFNMKKWTEAIAAFEMFLDKQYAEDNADTALYNLALACERNKLKSKAIAIFREMVTKNSYARRDDAGVAIKPEKPKPQDKQKLNNTIAKRRHHQKAYVELGRLLYEAGQYPEAATHLTAAINGYRSTKEKGDGNAEYYLGWVYLKENKLKEAAGCFAKVATFPAHPFAQDAALQCAILHIRNKDVKSAQVALKKMMSGPNPIKADQGAYYLGLAMARQEDLPKPKSNEKRYTAALANFETVLTKYPKSDKVPNALYWKGKCIEKLPARGGPAKAAVIYADFLKKYPTNKLVPDVTVDMGKIQFEAEKYDQVISAMKALLAPTAKNKVSGTLRANALYLLGWSYAKTGKPEASATALEEMASLQGKGPTNASASFQAGEARRKLDQYQAALVHYRKAAAAGKGATHEAALLRTAECEGLTNKWTESQATCKQFLELYPKSSLAPQVTLALGWACENLKQYPQAIAEYRKVIARKKNDALSARAQFQIGECLFVSNKLDAAITELIRVETKYSFPEWSAKALLELGRIRESQKNETEAIKRYNEVIERFPKTAAATVAKSLLRKLQ